MVEIKVARFAVVLIGQDMENVWLFETRTEAKKYFKKVVTENNLWYSDDTECHAWSQTGANLFITHVNDQTS